MRRFPPTPERGHLMIKLREADRRGLVLVDDGQRMALLWHKTNTNPLVRSTHAHTAHSDATLTWKKIKPLQTGIFFAVSSFLIYLKGIFGDFFMMLRPESTVILLLVVSATHPTSALITLLCAA